MTLAQLRDAADAWLAPKWTAIQAKQSTYASNHGGRYWQGVLSHPGLIPDDGVETAPDLTVKPTDQAEAWAEMGTLPASWPCALKIDVYQTGTGVWGYVATVYVRKTGNIYSRAAQVGPQTYRAHAWRLEPALPGN